mgnify:CR=1 FL=1
MQYFILGVALLVALLFLGRWFVEADPHKVARGLKWGVVTNKAERYAKPLIELLALARRCACVVGGDTTPHLKPHPAPLFAASELLGIDPAAAIYIGDDRRDIEAGRAAGMKTLAVRYGYLNGGVPETWGADAVVDCPQDVIAHLSKIRALRVISRTSVMPFSRMGRLSRVTVRLCSSRAFCRKLIRPSMRSKSGPEVSERT